jgi:hypothetical protein
VSSATTRAGAGIERGVSALANAATMAPPEEADRLLAYLMVLA